MLKPNPPTYFELALLIGYSIFGLYAFVCALIIAPNLLVFLGMTSSILGLWFCFILHSFSRDPFEMIYTGFFKDCCRRRRKFSNNFINLL